MRKFSEIKWLICDLDGTLLNSRQTVSSENISAIKEAMAKGIRFSIATGRMDLYARMYQEIFDSDEPMIACNGGLIRTARTEKLLHYEKMRPEYCFGLAKLAEKLGTECLLYSKDMVYYTEDSSKLAIYRTYNKLARASGSKLCPAYMFDMDSELSRISEDICKIYLYSNDAGKMDALRDYVNNHTDFVGLSSMGNNLDVAGKGQTKGNAIKMLADYYGYSADEICCFGDNDNDVPMLSMAGLSFAMRNGSYAAYKAADFLAESNDASGVGRAVRQFLL